LKNGERWSNRQMDHHLGENPVNAEIQRRQIWSSVVLLLWLNMHSVSSRVVLLKVVLPIKQR
jgi:hypothetical protein